MEGLGKEVHRRHGDGLERPNLTEARQVAGKRRGVAADIGYLAGGLSRELLDYVRGKARAWRVDHD